MKFKTTTKAIKAGSVNIRCAGYCDLSYLLRYNEPVAYTCGVYGWNYDVYEVYGLTICTGYRGMPGARLDKISEYDRAARTICDDWNIPYKEKVKRVEKLLEEFCKLNGGY